MIDVHVPGSRLYEVQGSGPLLWMIRAPPGTLARAPADPVVTHDQRGLSFSPLTGPPADTDVTVFAGSARSR